MVQRINSALKKLEKWSNKWHLSFAPNKCNYMVFTRDKRKSFHDVFDLELCGSKLKKVNEVKFLGITFDRYLSFKYHFDNIRERCIDRLNIIKVLSHKQSKLSQNTLLNTYKLLVQSLMDYSAFAFINLKKTNKRLFKLYNSMLFGLFSIKEEKMVIRYLEKSQE